MNTTDKTIPHSRGTSGKEAAMHADDVWREIYDTAHTTLDYTQFLTLCRRREKLRSEQQLPNFGTTVRVAVLGGATTGFLEGPLTLAVEACGLGCEMFSADYNSYPREMLMPDSATVQFKPDVAVVLLNHRNLPSMPEPFENLDRIQERIKENLDYITSLCEQFHAHHACDIILTNFHQATLRPLGNFGAKAAWDTGNFLRRLNVALGDSLPEYVHINDVESMAGKYGTDLWYDPRFWYHAKQDVSFECLIPFVHNTAQIIAAVFGRTAKCLVLDLDNTLWGGVVGDDGVEGILIGEGDPQGEAFLEVQDYAQALRRRGVLLAVCSKNDLKNAQAPFRQRSEMLLSLDDFAAFKANWAPKSQNLCEIANELNIGLDSLVFLDDNPVERELVRQFAPDVHVVELPDDPAHYAAALDACGCFEITSLSREDRERTDQYRANAARQELMSTVTDYAGFLESLEQQAVIRPFDKARLDRIVQLTNKTNQFNLTTRRMSRAEVANLLQNPEALTAYVRLKDKFGDNGLIALVYGLRKHDQLFIAQWLMSCRVLHRGVESLMCNYLVERAKEVGIRELIGTFVPTAKNGMVADHYQKLGFQRMDATTAKDETAGTHWQLSVDDYEMKSTAIQIVKEY